VSIGNNVQYAVDKQVEI